MSVRLYDDDSFGGYQLIGPFRTNTVNGTIAADAIIRKVKIPPNTNGEITGLTAVLTTGGSGGDADLAVGVGRSLAGTGDVAMIGTLTIGSINANATFKTASFTGGTFLAGDTVSIYKLAGTSDQAPVMDFMLEYKERYL